MGECGDGNNYNNNTMEEKEEEIDFVEVVER